MAELATIDRASPSLRQSVLKAAFEGRLVEQDPSDELAKVLLARLTRASPFRFPSPSAVDGVLVALLPEQKHE